MTSVSFHCSLCSFPTPFPPPSQYLHSLICCLLLCLSIRLSGPLIFSFSHLPSTLSPTMIIVISFLFNIYSYSYSFWHLPLANHFISGLIYLYKFNVFHSSASSIHPWEIITTLHFIYSTPLYLISQVSGSDRPTVSGWSSQRSR